MFYVYEFRAETDAARQLGTGGGSHLDRARGKRSSALRKRKKLGFLKPGGTLTALCLNTEHREKALHALSQS